MSTIFPKQCSAVGSGFVSSPCVSSVLGIDLKAFDSHGHDILYTGALNGDGDDSPVYVSVLTPPC